MVVLHHTAMQTCAAVLKRLCAPENEVSAHYVIGENGEVYQLVDEDMRAWHAGAGCWGGTVDVNSHSIGIELANGGPLLAFPPFPEPQMAALEGLLAGILNRHDIKPQAVIAHSDMAPTRKFDPGAKFDWRRLALGGLSVWPKVGAKGDFLKDARRFGYPVGNSDLEPVLAAFRLRFRPYATGPLDAIDRAMIHDLANRFAVDLTPDNP
ncbi:MAG: N-acetylmuramoyl-L-alanine amidase [Alphaproteobacteria bacterium]|nr:N-acetylmuramoyl-L-alanine amidase [Alphaproteobacteria bacterium]